MSACAREREPVADEPSTSGLPTKKRAVSKHTAEKWVKEFDKTLNTSVWLRFAFLSISSIPKRDQHSSV